MKIGILISGRGSNMAALIDAVAAGEIPDSEVAVVISNQADAAGLEKARACGVETAVIEQKGRTREDHDAEVIGELTRRGVELVCLAGYMRLLSPGFVRAFPNRIINIHPSLLPAFPGLDAQKQAFDAGVKVTGCTVHFVDELLDHGQTILQCEVERFDDDTVETLSARILDQEHRLYVKAVKQLVAPLPQRAFETHSSPASAVDGCLLWLVRGFVGGVIFGALGTSVMWWMDKHSYSFYDLAKSDNILGKIWLLLHIPLYLFAVVTGLRSPESSTAGYLLIFFYWFFMGTAFCTILQGVWRVYNILRRKTSF